MANDWQLSGIFTGGSGACDDITYQYRNTDLNVHLTGSRKAAREGRMRGSLAALPAEAGRHRFFMEEQA